MTSLVANNVRKNWESTSKLEEVKRATRLQTEALPISMAINILSYTYNQTLRLTQTHVGMALQSYSVPQIVQETLQRLGICIGTVASTEITEALARAQSEKLEEIGRNKEYR